MGPVEEKLKFAVFIDYDNIEIGVKSTLNRDFDVKYVLEGLKERGEVVSKTAYGNWSRHGADARAFSEQGVQMVQRDAIVRTFLQRMFLGTAPCVSCHHCFAES